jgi:hypothetical protein
MVAMANITDEHNIRHHVEGLIRAAVKGISKMPNPQTRGELRSYIQSLRVNTDTAIADGRLLDAAVFLADFGRRALFWLGSDLPKAADYSAEETARDDALLAESELGIEGGAVAVDQGFGEPAASPPK